MKLLDEFLDHTDPRLLTASLASVSKVDYSFTDRLPPLHAIMVLI